MTYTISEQDRDKIRAAAALLARIYQTCDTDIEAVRQACLELNTIIFCATPEPTWWDA